MHFNNNNLLKRIEELLIKLEYSPELTKVLICLAQHDKELTATAIEEKTGIRLPRVHKLLRSLEKKGFVKLFMKKSNVGRPKLVVRLAKPLDQILHEIINTKRQQLQETTLILNELEKILNNIV
jgi:predicted transcriptional regulator